MQLSIGREYLKTAIKRLRYYKELGEKTFEQLTEQEMHYSPNSASNSIAVIIQHLSGNMLSRWTNFLAEDGEKEWRQRDAEFDEQPFTKAQLLTHWQDGWNCFLTTLGSLTEDDLLKTVYIRQEPLTVIDAINRQLAHYPLHIGQMLYIGKMIKDTEWKSLSIPRGQSNAFNNSTGLKDPANKS